MYSKMQKRSGFLVNGLTLCSPAASAMTISPGSTSRTNRRRWMSSAQVSELMIQASASLPTTSGPHAQRVAHADDRCLRQRGQRIGALDLTQSVDQPVEDGALSAHRDQVVDDLGVACRVEQAAAPYQLFAQLVGVWFRLPLWQIASPPTRSRKTAAGHCAARPRRSSRSGTWPIAEWPRSLPMTSFELKLSLTSPMPRCALNCSPS